MRHISHYLATAPRRIADNNEDTGLNTCTFAGRLVADAETKYSQGGAEICSFRIASDTGWGDHKKTHWLGCVLFGERGSKLAPYLRKGDPITVVGDLAPPRLYEANGETRVAQDLVVREVALQGSKNGTESAQEPAGASGGSRQGQGSGAGKARPSGASQAAGSGAPPFDDDIPF